MAISSESDSRPIATGIDEAPKTFHPGDLGPTIQKLASRGRVSRALIIRRCVEIALPMLESGEVPLVNVSQPSTAEVVS